MHRRSLLFGLVLCWLAWSAPVRAQDDAAEGVVVAVRDGEVIVDLGAQQGLPRGARVQLWRRVEVVHPSTGATIVDRFPVGELPLARVGELLSIATDTSGLDHAPAPGDFVVFDTQPAPVEVTPAAPAVETASPDEITLDWTFRRTLGQPLTRRIELYEQYLLAFPDAGRADEVERELDALYTLRDTVEDAARRLDAGDHATVMDPGPLRTWFAAPSGATVGDPVAVDVSVYEQARVERVRLFVRRVDGVQYEPLDMSPHGDFNHRVTLPPSWTDSPGTLRVFAQVVETDGSMQPVGGSAQQPHPIVLQAVTPDIPARRARSTARALFEYVDFWLDGDSDAYLRFESDYRYLIDWSFVRAIRVGVGIFQGEGGSVGTLESGGAPRVRNVNYGYTALETQFHDLFGIELQLTAGNHHQTDDGTAEMVLGLGGQLRIGRDDGTRLLLGGSFTEDVGNQGWIAMVLEELDDWPMDLGVLVTNLPVAADLGVSIYYGAGYRITDLVAVSARVGWNARTINHFGFTGGVGTTLTW